MKIFILAIVVLLLVTGVIIWESLYVTKTTTTLIHLAEHLPSLSIFDPDYANQDFDTFRIAYRELKDTWDNTKSILYLFIGHKETDQIESALEEAAIRYLADDIPGYRSARKRMIAELEKLRDMEKLSFDSLT